MYGYLESCHIYNVTRELRLRSMRTRLVHIFRQSTTRRSPRRAKKCCGSRSPPLRGCRDSKAFRTRCTTSHPQQKMRNNVFRHSQATALTYTGHVRGFPEFLRATHLILHWSVASAFEAWNPGKPSGGFHRSTTNVAYPTIKHRSYHIFVL